MSRKTNLGWTVHDVHPMAEQGYSYRYRVVSGFTHVDEYVRPCGVWVYLGWLTH
jgi:hypothetical protein